MNLKGGFRYKKSVSSAAFAEKKQLSNLKNLVYPRFVGYNELLDPSLGITDLVCLTICYDSRDDPPSIVDILLGHIRSEIHFHYKIFPVSSTPDIKTEKWLFERWKVKDSMLLNHYEFVEHLNLSDNPQNVYETRSVPETLENPREVRLNFFTIIILNLCFTFIFALIFSLFYLSLRSLL